METHSEWFGDRAAPADAATVATLIARIQQGDLRAFDDLRLQAQSGEAWAQEQLPLAQQALVTRAQQGEGVAFDRLWACYERAIYGFLRSRVTEDADIQDIVQNTSIEVWQKLSSYDPNRGSFYTFVRCTAAFMWKRHLDAQRRREQREGASLEDWETDREEAELSEVSYRDVLQGSLGTAIVGATGVAAHISAPMVWDLELPAEVFTHLLRLTFSGDSPPHQLLAFGFTKVTGWPPRRIAAELSEIDLRELLSRFEDGYLHDSGLADDLVRSCLDPLRQTMDRRFDSVVVDRKTLETYPGLHARLVGTTKLSDYYGGREPAAAITQWWFAVTRRTEARIDREGSGLLYELLQQARRRQAERKAARPRIDSRGEISPDAGEDSP
jgi:hypothetical protein